MQAALDEARAKWDHAAAPYDPTVLGLIRAAEAMFNTLHPDRTTEWVYFVAFDVAGVAGNGHMRIDQPIRTIDDIHRIEQYIRSKHPGKAIITNWELLSSPDGVPQ